jgi:hypothetical protein
VSDPFGVIITLQHIAANCEAIGHDLQRIAIVLAPLGGLVADFASHWWASVS